MKIDPSILNTAQDKVFSDASFQPKDLDGDEVTYCNVATLAVAQGVGCLDIPPSPSGQPCTADQIYNFFKMSDQFFQISMPGLQEIVNRGFLIFAVLPSWRLQQAHGHICTLTTGTGDHSGRWGLYTPFAMNLGRAGTCFRRRGVNWAFQMIPDFFSWGAVC